MLLDTRTLFVAITIAYGSGAMLLLLMAVLTRTLPWRIRGSWIMWGTALALSAIGSALLGRRGILPDFLTLHLANSLILIGYGLRANSLTLLKRGRLAYIWLPLAPVLGWVVLYQFEAFSGSVAARTFYIQSFCILSALLSLRECPGLHRSMPVTAFLLVAALVIDVVARITFITTQVVLDPDDFLISFGTVSLQLCILALLIAIMLKVAGLGLANFEYLQHAFATEAETDPISGLPSRACLLRQIKALAETSRKAPAWTLTVIRFDQLESYRERFGVPLTEALVRLIGKRLRGYLPGEAEAFDCGDGDFAVLIADDGTDLASVIHQISLVVRLDARQASDGKIDLHLLSGSTELARGDTAEAALSRAISRIPLRPQRKPTEPLAETQVFLNC